MPQQDLRESELDRWKRVGSSITQLRDSFSTVCCVANEWWDVLEQSIDEVIEWSEEGQIAHESGLDTIRSFENYFGRSMDPQKVLRIREPHDPRLAPFGRTLNEWSARSFKCTHELVDSLKGFCANATAERAALAVDVDRRASRIARDVMTMIDNHRPDLSGGTDEQIIQTSKAFAEVLRSKEAVALMDEVRDVERIVADVLLRIGNDALARRENATEGAVGSETALEGNYFVQRGEVWVVRYDGMRAEFRHRTGMLYIQELLRRPGVRLRALDVSRIAAGEFAVGSERSRGVVDAKEEGLADERRSVPEIVDARAVREAAERLEELRAKACQADLSDQEESDMEYLEDFVTSIEKRSRKTSAEDRNAGRQVGVNIKRTIDAIGRNLPGLAEHLKAFIRDPNGVSPWYEPATATRWTVTDLAD